MFAYIVFQCNILKIYFIDRFIAERGEGGQLMHVEKIDEAFKLKALATSALEKVPKPAINTDRALAILSSTPR